ncbi:hypothetical protein [Sphingorhabdus sp.]|uniref:hypothetical protein n=1 Tax=Sphingorhabdus sp. TaxID=1902408 RepID=UPI0037CA3420
MRKKPLSSVHITVILRMISSPFQTRTQFVKADGAKRDMRFLRGAKILIDTEMNLSVGDGKPAAPSGL